MPLSSTVLMGESQLGTKADRLLMKKALAVVVRLQSSVGLTGSLLKIQAKAFRRSIWSDCLKGSTASTARVRERWEAPDLGSQSLSTWHVRTAVKSRSLRN